MKKLLKIISVFGAFLCIFTSCAKQETPVSDEKVDSTPIYYMEKQEVAPAPFGAEMTAYYLPDGQISKMELFHPEFPDEIAFNYDTSSKLSSIEEIIVDDEYNTREINCMAELQYTKNEENCFVGTASIKGYDAFDLMRSSVVLDSVNEDLNPDAFALIYSSTYDIVGKSNNMEHNDFFLLGECDAQITVSYTDKCQLKEMSILFSLTPEQVKTLGSVKLNTWEYKKVYNDDGKLESWTMGARRIAFQYDADLNNTITTRYLNNVQESVILRNYENGKLSNYKRTLTTGEEINANIVIGNIGFMDANGNQIGKIEETRTNSSLTTKTIQIKNDEIRQNILANQDMWAYDEGDFPQLELVTHKITWKQVSTTEKKEG